MKSYNQKTQTVDNKKKDKTKNTDNNTDSQKEIKNQEQKKKEPSITEEEKKVKEVIDKATEKELELQEKLAEIQDKYLRLSAEFDNYRRRTLKEKMELTKFANEEILLKTLPLRDDFERALEAMEKSKDEEALRSGVTLIYNKFSEFLKQNGIEEIESINTTFNVDIHDAVAKIPVDDEDKKGKIVEVIQKGYLLQDKVIRHSKVVVGE